MPPRESWIIWGFDSAIDYCGARGEYEEFRNAPLSRAPWMIGFLHKRGIY